MILIDNVNEKDGHTIEYLDAHNATKFTVY